MSIAYRLADPVDPRKVRAVYGKPGFVLRYMGAVPIRCWTDGQRGALHHVDLATMVRTIQAAEVATEKAAPPRMRFPARAA